MDRADGGLRIEVVYSAAPREVEVVALDMPAGSTVADALRQSGLLTRHGLEGQALRCGVWGHPKPLETPLRNHDRVELYRPLLVDPKLARRLRYKGQRRPAPRAV